MVKRAARLAVAALALAGLSFPAALLGGGTAAAATTRAAATTADGAGSTAGTASQALATAAGPVSVAITGMSPTWAAPGSVITVTGSLTNTSKAPVTRLLVRLYASASPVTDASSLIAGAIPLYDVSGAPVPRARWRSGRIEPGQSVTWRIRFRARKIGMTAFGVYPLAAVAQTPVGAGLAASNTYLPYRPGRKSGYSRPARERIAWLWPLIDKPLLGEPWQGSYCTTSQAKALAGSLAPGGRLATLVAAGQGSAAQSGQGQSLASLDSLTWAVDPALLANAKALASCGAKAPKLAQDAATWLASVTSATAGEPLFAMPYGDPNVVALVRQNHLADLKLAFRLGRAVAGQILHRNLTPMASQPPAADSASQAAAIAWPAGGTAGYGTVENLSGQQIEASTVVLNRSALPQAPGTVVQTPDGGGGEATVVLANDHLTALLDSAGSSPGSAFSTAQEFLAETALLAVQEPGQPIVIAPPARWDPPAGLAADILADTASAPWLKPVSLTALTSTQSVPDLLPAGSPGEPSFGRRELRQLRVLGQQIRELVSIQARANPDLLLALPAIESSAWYPKSRVTAQAMLARVTARLTAERHGVQIVAGGRITLGGLKGSVPVSIDNRLGFAVKVRLGLSYSHATRARIVSDPALVTIPAHSSQTIKLRVQAAQVGSTTITMRLESQDRVVLPSKPVRMTVQATQVGVLGMIILAGALGVFLIASAARAVRRGRPRPAGPAAAERATPGKSGNDQVAGQAPAEPGPADGTDARAGAAEAATVVSERDELGTARSHGP